MKIRSSLPAARVNALAGDAGAASTVSRICRSLRDRPSSAQENPPDGVASRPTGTADRVGCGERLPTGRVGRAERLPGAAAKRHLRVGDWLASIEERRQLTRIELAEADEVGHAWELTDADQAEAGAASVGQARQPAQVADQQQLIVEIVLEPEHDLVVVAVASRARRPSRDSRGGSRLRPLGSSPPARNRLRTRRHSSSKPNGVGPSCRTSGYARKTPGTTDCSSVPRGESPLST